MYKFCVLLFCGDDTGAVPRTLARLRAARGFEGANSGSAEARGGETFRASPIHDPLAEGVSGNGSASIAFALLFEKKRYETDPAVAEDARATGARLFFDAASRSVAREVLDFAREEGSEILLFLRAGDEPGESVLRRLDCFFAENVEAGRRVGLAYLPRLAEGEALPKEFCGLPPGSVVSLADGRALPVTVLGAAVRAEDAFAAVSDGEGGLSPAEVAHFSAGPAGPAGPADEGVFPRLLRDVHGREGRFGLLAEARVTVSFAPRGADARGLVAGRSVSAYDEGEFTSAAMAGVEPAFRSERSENPAMPEITGFKLDKNRITITASSREAAVFAMRHGDILSVSQMGVKHVFDIERREDKPLAFWCLREDNTARALPVRLVGNKDFLKHEHYILMHGEKPEELYIRMFGDYLKYKLRTPSETINIMFSFNEALAKYAPVTMVSLYRNHQNRKIDSYVVYCDLSDYSISLIQRTARDFGQEVYFIQCRDAEAYDSFQKYSGSIECYFDLLAHEYLPQALDRVLYLDVDTYVNGDISELYFRDFGDNWLICAEDVGNAMRSADKDKDAFALAARGQGFNSGVILINLSVFREEKVSVNDYVSIINELNGLQMDYFGDQALFNIFMLKKPVEYISPLYNFLWLEHEPQNCHLRSYDLQDVVIFHCGGNEYKPWSIYMRPQDIALYESKMYLNKHMLSERLLRINRGWWQYAEHAPNHAQLLCEAMSYCHIMSVLNFPLIEFWQSEANKT
jgi:lipopolysaccharide biosynthesis glycosyltransferase